MPTPLRWGAAAVTAAALLIYFSIQAQAVRDRILQDVTVNTEWNYVSVNISFTCPIRYVNYFPHRASTELRIKMELLRVCTVNGDAAARRESVRPRNRKAANLIEVVYEGDIAGGPYLTLLFEHAVSFDVLQGSDFRSMTVTLDRQTGRQAIEER
ncbi:MAG: hypothetical protein ACR2RB_18895 [Gammaproteobacteria bacterium]